MEKLGMYKGREVFKLNASEMCRDADQRRLYAVAETGELVYKQEVVGRVDFNSGNVKEYDDHNCYPYRYHADRKKMYENESRKYCETHQTQRGKRRQTEEVSPEDVLRSQVVDPTPLDAMIDAFLTAARNATIETYVEVLDIQL